MVGMIEPGYYNVIYDELGKKQKSVVSWHGHFLVWGISRKDLQQHLKTIKAQCTPIMPGLCAVHQKLIELGQFGYKLWYILKSPLVENIPSANVVSGTRKPERWNPSRMPEKSVLEIS